MKAKKTEPLKTAFCGIFGFKALSETINILVNKAFTDHWFNKTHGLNFQKVQLAEPPEIARHSQSTFPI